MSDILDRLLGQPHTTSEPPDVTAQREAIMAEVVGEIRRLRQVVAQHDAVKALATQMKAALDAYEAAQKAAADKAAAEQKAAEEKAAADSKAAHAAAQQHPQQAQNQPHR
jgi:hypothetical protein